MNNSKTLNKNTLNNFHVLYMFATALLILNMFYINDIRLIIVYTTDNTEVRCLTGISVVMLTIITKQKQWILFSTAQLLTPQEQ